MDPHRILLLRELEEHGTIAAVARSMNVSPSAVSQQLAALQASVTVPLTRKNGRRLVLTEAGRALAQAGREIAEALAGAEAALGRFEQDPSGVVRLSAFRSAGLAFFRDLIGRVADGGAQLQLTDGDVSFAEFPNLTADNDIVIAHRLPGDLEWPERVKVVPLFREEVDIAVASGHRLAQQEAIDPASLVDVPWVGFYEGFPLTRLMNVVANEVGAPLKRVHDINDFFVVAEIVASGAAVALMPRRTMRRAPLDGVALRPLKGVALARQIDVLMRPETARRTAVQRVLAELQAIAATL